MSPLSVSAGPSEKDVSSGRALPARSRTSVLKLVGGLILTVGLLLLKLKGLLFLIVAKFKWIFVNPFEGFSLASLAVTAGSMALTIVAYVLKTGWWGFVIGFVLITLVHEIGHALMMRKKGLEVGAMLFIPFLGGAVTPKQQPSNAFDDAQIGIAGPVAGTVASLVVLGIFNSTGDPLYLVVAYAGFIINLLNLLPVGVLDGGRISAAVTKWMWVLGGAILFYMMVRWKSPLLLLVLLVALFQVYKAITEERNDVFYELTTAQRVSVAAAYFSLVLFLGYASVATHRHLLTLQANP